MTMGSPAFAKSLPLQQNPVLPSTVKQARPGGLGRLGERSEDRVVPFSLSRRLLFPMGLYPLVLLRHFCLGFSTFFLSPSDPLATSPVRPYAGVLFL